MKCPQGCGWEGTPEEYLKHFETCLGYASSNPVEVKKPTLEELFKGKVLDGYLEASRVRTLNQFMPFTFLFDEGLPTEEKITVKAVNKFEAAIKARDEFTRRRRTYHTTSRLVG